MVPPPFPPGPPCPHVAPTVIAAYDLMADRLTLVTHEKCLSEPVRHDSKPSDPYARGVADGVALAITALRQAASQVQEAASA